MLDNRIASIDILRALTMLLMIWVNDFWTLYNVPKWLQHAKATEDYLGFSDIILPLFLFIVGLSIPNSVFTYFIKIPRTFCHSLRLVVIVPIKHDAHMLQTLITRETVKCLHLIRM